MYYLWTFLSKNNCEIFVNFYEGAVGWRGQGTNKVVCLQDYSRTSSCKHFRPTWVLSHTFRYNTLKAVLFSLHFSEQVRKNLRAARPVPHSQHHRVNNTVIILNPLLMQTRQQTMNSAGEILPTITKAWKHTFSYSYTWNTRGTQQITQQRAAPMYLLPAQEIKWGLEWGIEGIHAAHRWLHSSTRLALSPALAPLGPARFTISGKFLDCTWRFIYVEQRVKISSRNSPFSPGSHRLEDRSQ